MSDGERAALVERLFSHHRTALLQYLTRLLSNSDDAEEVLQETYVRLLRVEHLDHLDDQVRRFLFKIATNLARDRFRQRKSRSYATQSSLATWSDCHGVITCSGRSIGQPFTVFTMSPGLRSTPAHQPV